MIIYTVLSPVIFSSLAGRCSTGAMASVPRLAMKVLLAMPGSFDLLPQERIRVLVSAELTWETQERIRAEILAVCAFVSDLHLQVDVHFFV